MDRHYIKPSEPTPAQAVAQHPEWLGAQLEYGDQTVDRRAVSKAWQLENNR
jgi:hypothetical protein